MLLNTEINLSNIKIGYIGIVLKNSFLVYLAYHNVPDIAWN